ncbi:hypothetical protein HKD37_03G007480 [Glycine soja]|nr:hypothetical protein GmHk_03G007482 [Glycine max]
MEETREDAGPAEQGPSNVSWWPSDFVEKFGFVSLVIRSLLNILTKMFCLLKKHHKNSSALECFQNQYQMETRLKELFDSIPTLDELHALGGEGFKANIILVDSKKDKKLSMLKKLIMALVRGLNSNPTAII